MALTELLRGAARGEPGALDRVFAALYPELRKIAHARLRPHTGLGDLGTTALVHESFVRLVEARRLAVTDRKHFFTYAAKTMRNIVIDFARRRQAERRGGAAERVTLDTHLLGEGRQDTSVIDIDNALRELEALDPALAQVVEMRYFGGYTDAEIAAAMDIADRTVRRHWDKARAFILAQLQP